MSSDGDVQVPGFRTWDPDLDTKQENIYKDTPDILTRKIYSSFLPPFVQALASGYVTELREAIFYS